MRFSVSGVVLIWLGVIFMLFHRSQPLFVAIIGTLFFVAIAVGIWWFVVWAKKFDGEDTL